MENFPSRPTVIERTVFHGFPSGATVSALTHPSIGVPWLIWTTPLMFPDGPATILMWHGTLSAFLFLMETGGTWSSARIPRFVYAALRLLGSPRVSWYVPSGSVAKVKEPRPSVTVSWRVPSLMLFAHTCTPGRGCVTASPSCVSMPFIRTPAKSGFRWPAAMLRRVRNSTSLFSTGAVREQIPVESASLFFEASIKYLFPTLKAYPQSPPP